MALARWWQRYSACSKASGAQVQHSTVQCCFVLRMLCLADLHIMAGRFDMAIPRQWS